MTDAHAKAVEAAHQTWCLQSRTDSVAMGDAVTAYLAAMRGEGWVMVRDVGPRPASLAVGKNKLQRERNHGHRDGWNDCYAAMLKEAGDGQ